ncbi:hypothetical protein NDU88_002469 [Pleurodeles waltl]|uniref:Uncharacterized protein n=1 Tax=Pleurodeles waltl TaxID=8319 RepID=A0AAV7M2J0_PLEWA|nr:hypothetical protein NDU88_002469 [Pleurodeles waltl]
MGDASPASGLNVQRVGLSTAAGRPRPAPPPEIQLRASAHLWRHQQGRSPCDAASGPVANPSSGAGLQKAARGSNPQVCRQQLRPRTRQLSGPLAAREAVAASSMQLRLPLQVQGRWMGDACHL